MPEFGIMRDAQTAKPQAFRTGEAGSPSTWRSTQPRCRGAGKSLGPWSRRRPPGSQGKGHEGRAYKDQPFLLHPDISRNRETGIDWFVYSPSRRPNNKGAASSQRN